MGCRNDFRSKLNVHSTHRDNSMRNNEELPYLLIGESAGKSVTVGGSNGLSAFRIAVVPSGGGVAIMSVRDVGPHGPEYTEAQSMELSRKG
jgi:hypothetical protein